MLSQFILDLNLSQILLYFDEPVNVDSLSLSGLAIIGQRGVENPATTFTFDDGTIDTNEFRDVITITLTYRDFTRLKATVGVGETIDNTFLTIEAGTVMDTFGNVLGEIGIGLAIQATEIVPDQSPPEFLSFSINLATSNLILTFSEPVSDTPFLATGFGLRENGSEPVYSLSNSTMATANLVSLTLQLTMTDLNILKSYNPLGDTTLEIAASSIADTAGNALTSAVSAVATNITCDTVNPTVAMLHVNMSTGEISFFADEPLDVSTFDSTSLTLQDTEINPNVGITLTGGIVQRHPSQPTGVVLQLNDEDFNEIKAAGLCTNVSNCFANYTSDLVRDICSNAVTPPPNNTTLQTTLLTPDRLQPTIVAFRELDLDRGTLLLEFSEPVLLDTLDLNALILQSFEFSPPTSLNCALRVTTNTLLGMTEFEVMIQSVCSDGIKDDNQLCTGFQNCYVNLPSGAILDVAGNPVTGSVLRLDTTGFVPDETGPSLIGFSIDMNTGRTILTFDEFVNPNTLDFTALTFQDALNSTLSYTLSGGQRLSTDSTREVEFSFSAQDLNTLKATDGLVTGRNNTYISFTSGLLDDLSGNDARPLIDGVNATIASSFALDMSPVSLVSFAEFNLETESLILSFSEPVDLSELLYEEITIQALDSENASSVTLSAGSASYVLGSNQLGIIIELSDENVVEIKLDSDLGTRDTDTYISLTSNAIKDVSGNSLTAVPPNEAEQVATYVPDRLEASLTNFTLDMDSGEMSLTFNDVVLLSSLQPGLITLQSGPDASIGQSYSLSTIILTSMQSGFVINFRFSVTDFDSIRLLTDLAITDESTYLSLAFGAARDYKNDIVRPIPTASGFPVGLFIPDTTRPEISVYTLDVDTGVLSITFTEPVNLTAFDITQLSIQSASNSSVAGQNITLTEGSLTPSEPASAIDITLVTDDINAIKTMMQLAVNDTTTYLTATDRTVSDMVGNPLREIPSDAGISPRDHIPDTSRPTLETFFLDLNSGMLDLTFSEAVLVPSLMVNAIDIQNRMSSPTVTVEVTGGMVLTTDTYSNVLTVDLNDDVVNALNSDTRIALSNLDTFLTIEANAVRDTRGLGLVAITRDNALSGTFSVDSTAPQLLGFSLNMEVGTLHLSFNEPVLSETFNATQFTIINRRSVSPDQFYTLSARAISQDTGTGGDFILMVALGEDDIFELKRNVDLATELSNTFISHTYAAVTDIYRNPTEELSFSNAISASNYTGDVTVPRLYSFTLDLNTGLLNLNISEPVNENTFNFTQMLITNNASTPVSYALTDGSITQLMSMVIIDLSDEDEFALKSIPELANDVSDTFLVVSAFSFEDGAGNNFDGIPVIDPLQAESVVGDLDRPELVSFRYLSPPDRAGIIIELTFSEVINTSTLQVDQITLQDTMDGVSTELIFRLTDGDYLLNNQQIVQINLTQVDFDALSSRTTLGTSISTTYLAITDGAVQDSTRKPLVGIPTLSALQASEYTVDLVQPELYNFTFDFNQGRILLTFSEAINVDSFQPNAFTLQDLSSSPSANYSLTSYQSLALDGTILTVEISPEDYDALNTDNNLVTSLNDTFLSVTANAITDFANNQLVPVVGLQAVSFIPDTSPPSLELFEFNLNTGTLTLQFTETIDIASFEVTDVTLQNRRTTPTQRITLTGGSYPIMNSSVVQITLTDEDLSALKTSTSLVTGTFNTFISIPSTAASDLSGQAVVPISSINALRASQFNNDTIRPCIVGFDFDFNLGLLTLEFNEVVDVDSFNITQLSFQSNKSQLMSDYVLTEGILLSDVSRLIEVQISDEDLNNLKFAQICTIRDRCFISFTEQLVTDTFQLYVKPEVSTDAVRIRNYTADMSSPSLVQFAYFNQNSAEIHLIFSEAVDPTSLNFTAILLQSFYTNPVDVLRLSSGEATGNGTAVYIQMSVEDAVRLKLDPLLCSRRGTCYIALEEEAILDMSENPSLPSTPGEPGFIAQDFIIDDSAPTLQYFNLDMNLGILELGFDEIVDMRTFQASGIALHATANQQFPNYRLTGADVTSSMFAVNVTIALSDQDITAIKATDFAKSQNSTFLSLQPSTIRELSAEAKQAQLITGLPVSQYTPDTVPPVIESFTLDLNSNRLLLTFNEPMNASSLNVSLLTLQSARSGGDMLSLTSIEIYCVIGSCIEIYVRISSTDIAYLKLNGTIGTTADNTYLDILANAISDQAGIALTPATISGDLIPDTSRMILESFVLDLFLGELRLTFDDIALQSTLDTTGITLQDAPMGTFFVSLTTSSTTASSDGYEIVIDLSLSDRQNLTDTPGVASTLANTFLSLQSTTIQSWDGISVRPIADGNALQAFDFISGSNGSELISFELDMNTGELALTFNNPVDSGSLNSSQITFHDGTDLFSVTVDVDDARSLLSGLQVVLDLADSTLDALLMNENIATSEANTYITLGPAAFVDVAGGSVTLNGSLMARVLTRDTTSPQLIDFILDLNLGVLLLTFDEVVLPESVNISTTVIQGGRNQSQLDIVAVRELTGGSPSLDRNRTVIIALSAEDQNYLKLESSLATDVSNTFLAFTSLLITDTFGNAVVEVFTSNATQAASVTRDTTSPQLLNFTLNLDTSSLVITFSEVVRSVSVNASVATLLGLPMMTFDLSPLNSVDGTIAEFAIQPPFLYNLQEVVDSTDPNITLQTADGFVTDYQNLPSLSADLIGQFIPDDTGPLLVSFTLDLSTATIQLAFNEVINSTTLNLTLIQLQNSSADSTELLLLDENLLTSVNLNELNITLNAGLFEQVRLNSYLGNSVNDTFVSIGDRALQDTFGNDIVGFHAAVPATEIISDTVNPELESVTLNMSSGQLILAFSEAINLDAQPLVTSIALHNTSSLTPEFRLTNESMLIYRSGRIVYIIIYVDLRPLREAMNFGTSVNNSFITISDSSFTDFGGLPLLAITLPRQIDIVVPDERGPDLIGFDLDMNAGELILHFDENVDISTLNTTEIILRNSPSDASHVEYVFITSTTYRLENYSDIVIDISGNDLNELNSMAFLATNENNTYLTYSGFTVADLIGNRGEEIPVNEAVQVDEFIPDISLPSLVRFEVDLNTSMISLVFDEVVDAATVNVSLLTLHSNIFGNGTIFTISGHEGATSVDTRLLITLSPEDINRLYLQSFCRSLEDCFVMIEQGLVNDIAGNPSVAGGPINASSFTIDAVRPSLAQFLIMDINSGILELSFSEIINVSSVQLTTLKFQSQNMRISGDYSEYTLQSSMVVSTTSDILIIELDRNDLNAIKSDTLLCTRAFDCYVRFSSAFLEDTFGNRVQPVNNTLEPDSTHYPRMFVRDTTGPLISSFNLDLEAEVIEVDFDELININVFRVQEITLQDSFLANTTYTLTGGSILSSNDTGMRIGLVAIDNGLIKADPLLATSSESTYLVNTMAVVTDVFGNIATQRIDGENPLPVSRFEPDVTPPSFVTFSDFNLETGILSLSFTEPIDASRIDYSLITLQSNAAGTAVSYTLRESDPTQKTTVDITDPNTLQLYLSYTDLIAIKDNDSLAISRSTTYLAFEREAFRDTAGNLLDNGIPTNAARQPVRYTTDTLPAELSEFSIDMNSGLLMLTFSDIIRQQVYNATAVTIQNADINPTSNYVLTGGVSNSIDEFGFVIEAEITPSDLDMLKYIIGLASSIDNTFITVTSVVTQNADGSDVFETALGVQAAALIPDTTPGNITAFSLDLNSGILSILANEPLDPSSFNPEGISLQNSPNASSMDIVSYTLTGGNAEQTNDSIYQLNINLNTADLNGLKRLTELATLPSNVFLSANSIAFSDFGTTPINSVSNMEALTPTNYLQDLTPPRLTQVTLDLNMGELRLSFNEVVNLTTLNVTSLRLQTESNASSPTAYVFEFQQLVSVTNMSDNISSYVVLDRTPEDFMTLKIHQFLGQNGSTFISFEEALVSDVNGHYLAATSPEEAASVIVLPDTTSPQLQSYNLDLNRGEINLEFDEPISNATFVTSSLQILVGNSSDSFILDLQTPVLEYGTRSISATTPFVSFADYMLRAALCHLVTTPRCINRLEEILNERMENTYLSSYGSSSLVEDVSGNPLGTFERLLVSNFTVDMTPPEVVGYTININTGSLILSFSEPVLVDNFTALSLQDNTIPSYRYIFSNDPDTVEYYDSNTLVNITLSEEDLEGVKSTPFTATATDNTHLSLGQGSFVDAFLNPVVDEVVAATALIADDERPRLQYFEFGPYEGQLTLSLFFTEPINYTSIVLSNLALQSDVNGTISYTLAYSEPLPLYSSVIRIPLDDQDTDNLAMMSPLGLTNDSTYLVVPEGSLLDMQGLPVFEFGPSPSVTSARSLVLPRLISYWINLQARLLQMTFSAEVLTATFDGSHITIQNTVNSSEISYTFIGGTAMQVNDSVILVNLDETDVNGLQADLDLATSTNNTYLSLSRGLVLDTYGLAVKPIQSNDALRAANFTPDGEAPQLMGFTLSLSGRDPIILTFSETVIVDSFMPSLLYLVNSPSNDSFRFNFSNATIVSPNSNIVEVFIPLADKGVLQTLPEIATDVNNTFLTVEEGVFRDSDGENVTAVTVPADAVIPDDESPQVTTFNLNMDLQTLQLVMSEPVNGNSFRIESFTLQNAAVNPTANYTLTSTSYLINVVNFNLVNIALSNDDLNAIKALQICTMESICYLSHDAAAISDVFNQPAEELNIGRQVNNLVRDSSRPILISFDLFDLTLGIITITFNETVQAGSFMPMGITLLPIYDSPRMSHTLQDANLISGNGPTVTLRMSQEDMTAIQLNPFLCASRGSCYISLQNITFTDVQGNRLVPSPEGLIAQTFITDSQRPELTNFTLDMNIGVIALTFSEPVTVEVFEISELAIQGSSNDSSGAVPFTGGTMVAGDSGRLINITLSAFDVNTLKLAPFANSIADSFLTATSGTTRDLALAPNYLKSIFSNSSQMASYYISDMTSPALDEFNLDLDRNTVELVFEEPMDLDRLSLNGLTIHSGSPGVPNTTLSSSNIFSTTNGEQFSILLDLSEEAIIALKSSNEIGTTTGNTNLEVSSSSAFDIAGNQLLALDTPVTMLQPDTIRPELESFSLDLTINQLRLTFDDVVSPSTFDPTGITLQGNLTRVPGEFVTLTSSSTLINPQFGYVLTIDLGTDSENIRLNEAILDNTFLTMLASTIDDCYGKDVIAITDGKALEAANVTFDLRRPEINAFDLDLDSGRLSLEFSDSIRTSSLNEGGFTLQNAALSASGNLYTLTGSDSVISDGTTITLEITNTDLNAIKSIRSLASSANNTFLTVDSNAATDVSGNRVQDILNGQGINVRSFTPDNTVPVLRTFILDLDSGTVQLNFTEVIDPLSVDPSEIAIQDVRDARITRATTVDLTGSTLADNMPSSSLELQLSVPVIRQLTFAEFPENTYVILTSASATDMAGNPVAPVSSDFAVQASEVIDDLSSPVLEAFNVDLGLGTVTLDFSKPILISSLQLSLATLQNHDTTPSESFLLTDATTESGDGSVIVLDLSYIQANILRDLTTFGTSMSDTYLNVLAGLAEDLNVRLTAATLLQVRDILPDTVAPRVSTFVLDLNTGYINLTFDEPLTSFSANGISIQNSDSQGDSTVQLFNSTVVSQSDNVVAIELNLSDLDALNEALDLATSNETTYLVLTSGAAADALNNSVTIPSDPVMVTEYIRDQERPSLLSFSLNLGSEIILLTFSEVIDGTSFNFPEATLLSNRSMMAVEYSLTDSSSVLNPSGRVIEVHLIGTDAAATKGIANLATNINNTYISITEDFASDPAGNSIVLVAPSIAIQANEVVPDLTSPYLMGFTLNLIRSELTLSFSETISISTLDLTQVTLQQNRDRMSSVMYLELQGGYYTLQDTSTVVVSLLPTDANMLKDLSVAGLMATSPLDTHITLTSLTVQDTSGHPINAIPNTAGQPATLVVRDTLGPMILGFFLDMNTGNLTLQFDETVNISTFDLTTVRILKNASSLSATVSLTTATMPSSLSDGTVVMVTLTSNDLNAVKGAELCNSTNECYVAHTEGLVFDRLRQSSPERTSENALMASSIRTDFSAPTLEEFVSFDRNTGILQLRFSETMYVPSVSFSELTLIIGGRAVPLTGGRVLSDNAPILELELTNYDLNSIKADGILCTGAFFCGVRITNSFITDYGGNFAEGTLVPTVTVFIDDTVGPSITSFRLDLDMNTLVVFFDEVVNQFRSNVLVFQDALNATKSYRLTTDYPPLTSPQSSLNITLDMIDVNSLKAMAGIAKSVNNTFLIYPDTMAVDTSSLNAVPRQDGLNPLQADYVAIDVTSPELNRFISLDFDGGFLEILFTEPVDPFSYTAALFTLQSSSSGVGSIR